MRATTVFTLSMRAAFVVSLAFQLATCAHDSNYDSRTVSWWFDLDDNITATKGKLGMITKHREVFSRVMPCVEGDGDLENANNGNVSLW